MLVKEASGEAYMHYWTVCSLVRVMMCCQLLGINPLPDLMLTLRWRHNGRGSVSNHQPHGCLLNRLFRRRSRKHESSASLAFVWGIHRGPVNFPHKWPVMRKMFPFDDVIMFIVKSTSRSKLQWHFKQDTKCFVDKTHLKMKNGDHFVETLIC